MCRQRKGLCTLEYLRARSKSIARGAGCPNWASPDLWEPRVGNCPWPPGQRVEQAWRTLQSGLRLCPVHHWVPHGIHAHVSITVLALLLERVAERACGDTWQNIRDDLKRIQLGQLLGDEHEVWQVTKPTPEASKRLKLMGTRAPEPILKLV